MSTLLKQEAYDDKTSYNERLEELKNCKILFIDDLFKTNPSLADIKNCFTIINYRYNLARSNADEKFITIISSEKTIAEITKLDEAIGTRIYELANGNLIAISKDSSKNFRTRGIIND